MYFLYICLVLFLLILLIWLVGSIMADPTPIPSGGNLNENNAENRPNERQAAAAVGSSLVTTLSYSPLSALGGNTSGADARFNNSEMFGVIEAAVGHSQANMMQLIRSEMQVAIRDALSQQSAVSNNQESSPSNHEQFGQGIYHLWVQGTTRNE